MGGSGGGFSSYSNPSESANKIDGQNKIHLINL